MPSKEWPNDVLELLAVPDFKNVYAVGSFAKYVTLYSQQVRALNLIAALREKREIGPGTAVFVVGAGAAGLTASAAAALLGAKVTILDELEGPMELQYNSRQRWLHPYVYDWPHMHRVNDETTHLPILNWTASYAQTVAQEIESEWNRRAEETHISSVWRARVDVGKFRDSVFIHWTAPGQKPGRQSDCIIILAVGFGLEQNNPWAWSYWSDDNIDDSFRKSEQRPKWLVSGYGDGALTDLMRLCIRRFRHHEVLKLLEGSKDIKKVQLDIEEIQRGSKTETAEWVHDRFFRLETKDLEDKLRTRLRKEGPTVHLTGRSPWIYAPGSSLLNRLIASLLEKVDAFQWVMGTRETFAGDQPLGGGGTGTIRRAEHGYYVELANGEEFYDHVICRHGPCGRSPGPHPRIRENFRHVYEACSSLISRWEKLTPADDPTRQLNWPQEFLRSKRSFRGRNREREEYLQAVDGLGLRAKSLAVYKDLRADGGSTTTFQIDDLAVDVGLLHGMWCRFEFTTGVVGRPQLNAAAQQLNMRWIPDPGPALPDASDLQGVIEVLRERARCVSGELKFGKPLRAGDPAVSFGFSIEVLNGDALSTWEFEELYPNLERRLHCNRRDLVHNLEYFARTIWFPVGALHMQLRLPEQITKTPYLSEFECTRREDITRGEIAPQSVLHLSPDPKLESGLSPTFIEWRRTMGPGQTGGRSVVKTGDNSWELTVEYPPIATAYSIDFELGSPKPGTFDQPPPLAGKARAFRRQLVGLRETRHDRSAAKRPNSSGLLRSLHSEVAALGLDLSDEPYQMIFMAYDDEKHRLVVIDGLMNGNEPTPDMWGFWLPFGIGLGGACFKQADRIFYYDRVGQKSSPEVYLNIPGRSSSAVLVSVPLDHPEYRAASGIERSRQCIGVINLGSENGNSSLRRIMTDATLKDGLWERCQGFCCELLKEFEEAEFMLG